MRSRTIYRFLLALLAATFGMQAISHAAVQNRITSAVEASSRVALAHTVTPRAALATDLGAAPSSLPLEGMTLRFNMTDTQKAALDQLLVDQQNPASSRYHQWLTPQQFGAQFGLSADDIAKVSAWLTAQGFTITGTANSSTFITFKGTAAQVQQAFGTTLHSLDLNGEHHIANLTEPSLPSAIANVVVNITGLNDFRPRPHLRSRQVPLSTVRPNNTITTTNGAEHFIAPGDFYTIYDVNPLLSSGINGTGITIAVMGQVDVTPTDIAAFRSASGLSANLPTVTTYGTDPGSPTGSCASSNAPASCAITIDDVYESLLDLEWAGATAPSASIIFVNSKDVIDTSLVNAIDNNIAPIMTVSYGNCEAAYSSNQINSLNLAFEQANAQGITLFGPAGDDGATDCDGGSTSATGGLAVDFPASSPYVTGVGGTMFNEGTSNYWNGSNGANGGSAISYIPETVWNETPLDLTQTPPGFGATGGGASLLFAKPYWQSGTGVPNDFSRDVPDVALNAAAQHDGYLVCAQGSCVNGAFYNAAVTNAAINVFGGTSVSTPSFAGITALVEQQLGGKRLGNINPNLYALAGSTYYNNIFHDITSGNNDSPCTSGTTNCPNGGSIGYNAGTGYDQATGWGSVDVSNLATKWSLITPVATPTGPAVSLTTVTASPTSTTSGTTITLTIKVAASGNSNTTVPTGTVQILVDGTSVGTTAALASGSVTYSLATTSLSGGGHTVAAIYSGDANFGSSKGTASIDITSATSADFTLTASTSSITVAGGVTSPTVTFTVAAKNGFTGAVSFAASGTIDASGGFTPASVTLSSTATSATTAFSLQAITGDIRSGKLRVASFHPPVAPSNPSAPWYVIGSGATFAGLLLFTLPRRRRWASLFVMLLSVAVLGAVGCGSSSSSSTSTAGSGNTPSGTYTIQVTATGSPANGTPITHTANVTVIVQ